MKCQGNFKFKGLVKKDGGSFTNDKGEVINYKESTALKVDELIETGEIVERTFKVATDSAILTSLKDVKPYTDIILEFDVVLYRSGTVKLVPLNSRLLSVTK